MISITLSRAAAILQGDLYGQDLTIDAVTTDTRKITAGCLFVALKGERFDAHDFAEQAKENGAGALLVSRRLDIDLPQIVVKIRVSRSVSWPPGFVSRSLLALSP